MFQKLWSFVHYLEYLIHIISARVASIVVTITSTQTTFVVDTTAPANTGSNNVYPTLAAAAVARRLVNGPATVDFRQATVHPALAYDLRDAGGNWNTTFTAPKQTIAQTFAAGSTLAGVTTFAVATGFQGGPGTSLITAPDVSPQNSVTFRTKGTGGLFSTAGGDFFNAANVAGQTAIWFLAEAGPFFQAGAALLCARGANARIVVNPTDGAVIASNCLFESAGGQILVQSLSSADVVSLTQANMATTGPNLVRGVNLINFASTNNSRGPNGGNPALQAGGVTLVAGTTAAIIPATITATSRIFLTVNTSVPGAGNLTVEYAALAVDRVIGVAGAGGGFKPTALIAAGTINVNDVSSLDWLVVN